MADKPGFSIHSVDLDVGTSSTPEVINLPEGALKDLMVPGVTTGKQVEALLSQVAKEKSQEAKALNKLMQSIPKNIPGISPQANNQLNKKIIQDYGITDPKMIASFRESVKSAYDLLSDQADKHNATLDSLTSSDRRGVDIINSRRTTGDASNKQNFDVTTSFASEANPGMLGGDYQEQEQKAFDLLQQGKMERPDIFSDAVLAEAEKMVGEAFFDKSSYTNTDFNFGANVEGSQEDTPDNYGTNGKFFLSNFASETPLSDKLVKPDSSFDRVVRSLKRELDRQDKADWSKLIQEESEKDAQALQNRGNSVYTESIGTPERSGGMQNPLSGALKSYMSKTEDDGIDWSKEIAEQKQIELKLAKERNAKSKDIINEFESQLDVTVKRITAEEKEAELAEQRRVKLSQAELKAIQKQGAEEEKAEQQFEDDLDVAAKRLETESIKAAEEALRREMEDTAQSAVNAFDATIDPDNNSPEYRKAVEAKRQKIYEDTYKTQADAYGMGGGKPPKVPPRANASPDPMDEYNRSQEEQSFNDRLVYGASLAALIARSADMGAYQVLEEASTEGRVKGSTVYDSATKGIRNTQGIIGGAIGGLAGSSLGGSLFGATAGAALGPLGIVGGMALGSTVGAALPGPATFTEMLSSLQTIADNTSERVQGFSPELISSSIDRTLSFLEQDMNQAAEYGSSLASIYDSNTQLKLAMSDLTTSIVVKFEPTLVALNNMLLTLIPLIEIVASRVAEGTHAVTDTKGYLIKEMAELMQSLAGILEYLGLIEENTDPDKEDKENPIFKEIEDFFDGRGLIVPKMQR